MNSQGYSLIELVVVISLLVVLGLSATALFYSSLRGGSQASVIAQVKQQGEVAMITMERMLRNSVRLVSCTPTQLVVEAVDGTQKTLAVVDGRVSIDGILLTGTDVVITAFSFTCIDGLRSKPDQVVIRMSLRRGDMQMSQKGELFEQVFQSTVTLRNY